MNKVEVEKDRNTSNNTSYRSIKTGFSNDYKGAPFKYAKNDFLLAHTKTKGENLPGKTQKPAGSDRVRATYSPLT